MEATMQDDEDGRLQRWNHDGFFVLRRMLPESRLSELAEACDHVLQQLRAASPDAGHTTTHITGLLAPEFFVDRPELATRLAEFASSRDVVACVRDLGRPLEGELNLRATHYFHEPSSRDYDGAWHRDGDEGAPLDCVDDGLAARRSTVLRLRVAFCRDDHLEYVPGSHRRRDTPEELRLRRGAVRNAALASGSVRIELEPGEVCVFDTWGIHRGRYRHGCPRRSLDLVFGFGARKSSSFDALKYARLAGRKIG
jgi:hypothetical protein